MAPPSGARCLPFLELPTTVFVTRGDNMYGGMQATGVIREFTALALGSALVQFPS